MPSDIEIKVVKDSSPAQHIELRDFVSTCAALQKSVENIGRCVGKRVKYTVGTLEVGSAVVGLDAMNDRNVNDCVLVASLFKRTLQSIERGSSDIDERIDYQALKAFDSFSQVINRGHTIAGQRLKLTSRFVTHLAALLENEDPALGSVTGTLEIVDVHGAANQFSLFTSVHNERVNCVFNDDDLSEILKAIRKQVTVYGTVYYSQRKVFPSRVEVESFEVHPDNSSLSNLLEFKNFGDLESRQPNG